METLYTVRNERNDTDSDVVYLKHCKLPIHAGILMQLKELNAIGAMERKAVTTGPAEKK